jgi:hypothetical protein
MKDAKIWMAEMVSNDFDIEDFLRSVQRDAKQDYDTDMQEFAEWCSETGLKYLPPTGFWEKYDYRKRIWIASKTTDQMLDDFKAWKEEQR